MLEAKFGDNPEQIYKPRSWYGGDTVLSVVQKQGQVVLYLQSQAWEWFVLVLSSVQILPSRSSHLIDLFLLIYPNLCMGVCVCVCVWGGVILPPPPCCFPLNDSEMVKAVTLALCSIQ